MQSKTGMTEKTGREEIQRSLVFRFYFWYPGVFVAEYF